MEELLKNDFIRFHLTENNGKNITIQLLETNESYFEIEDINSLLVLDTTADSGTARFSNANSQRIKIINYDNFVTQLPNNFQRNRDRCDIILIEEKNNSIFLLGELKNIPIVKDKKRHKIRKEVKTQLLNSLNTIIAVEAISNFINDIPIKRCCYFNKQTKSPEFDIINAITTFNRPFNNFPDGLKMPHSEIEKSGFEFWEYTGTQTVRIS